MEIFKQLSDYKKILEDKGYDVIYIGLYGSQNYNLDDEESDIDVKATKGKISLRRLQFRLAEKSPTMTIYLGKVYLNQDEKMEVNND